ncbi:MAG: (Fe-S)-binding protein [Thermaerobacter sp.]|nr:(Fe-S)-binding protein [Thermaerobacter sp.]
MTALQHPILDEINHCNKCGFCLPACPTYVLTGSELASPRGRIAMVEATLRGEIGAGGALEEALSSCLGCRACETACPSQVPYHRILEAGRDLLRASRSGRRRLSLISRQLLWLVRHPNRLGRLTRLAERIKPWALPRRLRQYRPMLGYRPEILAPPPGPKPEDRGAVSFFSGCVMGAVFPDANRAAEALLALSGVGATTPLDQGCCGALQAHAGRRAEARQLARQNIAAFEPTAPRTIVTTAGGCGAMLAEYAELLARDDVWRERARQFAARVRDWSAVLGEMDPPIRFQGAGERVVLQNSCHLVNVSKAGTYSVSLLQRVEGDDFISIPGQDRCCGSAGLYNFENPGWALRILDAKMEQVAQAAPDRILVNNPGCHLQMQWGAHRHPGTTDVRVEHLARYLYRAALRAQSGEQALTPRGG